MRYLICILLLALVLMTSGCTTTKQEVAPPQETITIVATPTPEPTVTPRQAGVDPIIGAWDNGMVFNADGTVGSDGNTFWKANDMLEYSYFVTSETRAVKDVEAGRVIDPSATATEWIYNPHSDTLHMRDSNAGVRRVLLTTVTAKPVPAVT
jgi:hypothetical protein